MKLVIDIPDSLYENILICWENIHPKVWKILKDGTVLPKGHGRLIDADSMKRIDAIQRGDFNSIESIRAWIDIMPTVIEAGRGEEG